MRWSLLSPLLAVLCLAPPVRADESKPAKTVQVPYRLTKTAHVLIRVKINGKGPFNFILDTGAPALFVATKVCDKLGVKKDDKGWGTFDRFELEGGLVIEKARGRVEDPFQLEGMNSLGLAGTELHGMIGYNLIARYRVEFDFTKDKMAWTPLDFTPPPPVGLGGKGTAGMDSMAALVKFAAAFLGNRPKPEVVGRGFFGMDLEQRDDQVQVRSVLEKSPAAEAGLHAEDRIAEFQGTAISKLSELRAKAAKIGAGETVKLTVVRGGKTREITLKTGEGL